MEHRHAGAAAALCGFRGGAACTDDNTEAVNKRVALVPDSAASPSGKTYSLPLHHQALL